MEDGKDGKFLSAVAVLDFTKILLVSAEPVAWRGRVLDKVVLMGRSTQPTDYRHLY